jgi:hypothetical protein
VWQCKLLDTGWLQLYSEILDLVENACRGLHPSLIVAPVTTKKKSNKIDTWRISFSFVIVRSIILRRVPTSTTTSVVTPSPASSIPVHMTAVVIPAIVAVVRGVMLGRRRRITVSF